MKQQSQWLFETPLVSEPNTFSNPYFAEPPPSVEQELSVMATIRISPRILFAIGSGERNINKLTNIGFFALYPERNGAPISRNEPNFEQLKAEWEEIRETVVKPLLRQANSGNASSTQRIAPLDLVVTPMPSGSSHKLSGTAYKYGTPKTIEALKWIAQEWHRRHPNVTFMVRDISRKGGGKIFKSDGKTLRHKSHRIGLDADVQLWVGSQKVCMENRKYQSWKPLIQELVTIIHNNPTLEIDTIGFSDSSIRQIKTQGWVGHTCHLHIRFCMPEEYQSRLNLSKVYDVGENRATYKKCSRSNEFEFESGKHRRPSEAEYELSFFSKAWISPKIMLAIGGGERNIDKLTNIGFFALHPERNKAPISRNEPNFEQLKAEWEEIRNTIVRPLLSAQATSQSSSASTSHKSSCKKSTREHLRRLALAVESMGTLPGFAKFAEGAAWSESRWNNCATNAGSEERKRALSGFRVARSQGWYATTPYTEDDFGFGTGGWFGLMPSSALVAGGSRGPFISADPRLVHDPAASVAMMADMVFRLVKKYKARNWLAVRRGMKAVRLVDDYAEREKTSQGVRSRFYTGLTQAGVANPETFMQQTVDVSSYPGVKAIYEKLRTII